MKKTNYSISLHHHKLSFKCYMDQIEILVCIGHPALTSSNEVSIQRVPIITEWKIVLHFFIAEIEFPVRDTRRVTELHRRLTIT